MKTVVSALACLLVLSACAPTAPKPAAAPDPSPEIRAAVESAAALAARGSYLDLKEACLLFAGLYGSSSARRAVASPYFRAAFLLALREMEIGMSNPAGAELLTRLIKENPELAGYESWLVLAGTVQPRVKGFMKDFGFAVSGAQMGEDLQRRIDALRLRAADDELAAYLYLSVVCPRKSPYDAKDDVASILAAHHGSSLLLFRSGFCPSLKPDVFESVLAAAPGFVEARGFLAEAALGRGELLTAEEHLLAVHERIPGSPYTALLLASVYFLTEEFERSIEFCDAAIALAREYRDAYLTKAISLSQLGRYPEAIAVLNEIIEMQYYLQGEARYWLAWNYRALGDDAIAQTHIEEAKTRLPMNSEVFGLAGTIALDRNELDRAEKDFREALSYGAGNTEALFGLGRIAETREKWIEAAGHHEKAAEAVAAGETALGQKIAEIRAAALPEARRARMLAKKESQLQVARATRATAVFNAAADHFNAGRFDRAAELARKAAEHPQFRDRAVELLSRIK